MNNKNTIIGFLLSLFFLIGMEALAQDKVLIRGNVTSSTDNEPLIGVSVVEVDKDNRTVTGTQTDLDGNYSLRVSPESDHKLMFSYIGFKSKTVNITENRTINCVLDEDAQTLGEVTVTAQKRVSEFMGISERDMTFAYSKIEASEVENLPVASIDEALQGRMSGVDIVANSGEPGAGMSIRIRGISSINAASDPLIVVDGIPYDTKISEDFDFATADEENYSQLLNISPSDIEEITVLKDAASCAIYGSRGANGVLMIKTKRGQHGPPRITYAFKGSIKKEGDPIKTLSGDQYVAMIQEAFQNSGTPINLTTYPEFARDPNNPYYYHNYGQNTDWVDAITQTGFTQDHSLSISGGGQKALYRMSVGYYDDEGTVKGQGLQRFTTNFNMTYNISERLRVLAEVSYTHATQDKNYMSDLLASAYTKMPNQSVYEYTDTGIRTPNYFSPESTPQGSFTTANLDKYTGGIYNPVAMANEGKNKATSDRIRPRFNIQYNILDGLIYKGDVAFDIASDKNKKFLPQIATGRPWTENSVNRATDGDSEMFLVTTKNEVLYLPELGKNHTLTIGGLLTTRDKKTENYNATSANAPSINTQDPSFRLISAKTERAQEREVSLLGQVHYNLLDRYKVAVVARYDGDSKYSKNNRFGFFPSISGRYTVSNEAFLKEYSFLDDFSLRASYGLNGNPPSKNYLYFSKYSSYDYLYLGEQGVRPLNMQFEELRWEKKTELNLGANLILFEDRVNIDFNWYKNRTSDMFWENVAIPNSSGYSKIPFNGGTMDNKGWEFSLFSTPYKDKDWNVNFRVNFSHSANIVRSLPDNLPLEDTPTAANGKYLTRIQIGNPYGSFYGYRYNGVYLNESETIAKDQNGNPIYTYEDGVRTPVKMKFWYPTNGYQFEAGDARYEDINNDGNINYQDIVYLGDPNPTLTGGFGPGVKYKNWSVDSYFYFRYGFDIVNMTKMNMESMYGFDNQSTATLKRWRYPYENAADAPADLIPRALYKKGYNWLASDRYVEDGSFLRWQSLTVRYTFDRQKIQRLGLSALAITGTLYNLYTWTNYTGMDPDTSGRLTTASGLKISGFDNSKAPKAKTFTLGLNLSF